MNDQPRHESYIDPWEVGVIDAHHVRPGVLACHVLRDGDALGLIDVGPNPAIPYVLRGLEQLGLEPSRVTHLFVTHVHLDHAGGVGRILAHLPQARVYVHPSGAKHLVQPARLEQATREVYGAERYERYFGALTPVPEERIVVVDDGMVIPFGHDELLAMHTLGHARHHYCLYDRTRGTLFAGDNFGIAYRELVTDRGCFAFPSTTPTQFDPQAARESLERLVALKPQALYVAHYSLIDEPPRLAAELTQDLEAYVAMARGRATGSIPTARRVAALREDLFAYTLERLRRHHCALSVETIRAILGADLELNAMGLDHWLIHPRP